MVVLDTDAIIAMIKGDADAFSILEKYDDIYISSFTWYELMVGCAAIQNSRKQLETIIDCLSGARVLGIDDTVATFAARNKEALKKKGRPSSIADVHIAANCIVHQQTLLTRNIKHFKHIPGLSVEKW